MSAPREPNPLREMSLIGHLEELRMRLIVSVATLFVAVVVAFNFSGRVLEILVAPVKSILATPEVPSAPEDPGMLVLEADADGALRATRVPEGDVLRGVTFVLPATDDPLTTRSLVLREPGEAALPNIVYSNPLGPFLMSFKVAIVMGVLLSLPIWIHQIWLFVAPGLTEKEKRVVKPLLSGALFLFPLGAFFAYFMIYMILHVMKTYQVQGIGTMYDVATYLKLMTTMMLVFGVIFELPLVVALLTRIGVLTPALMVEYRRHIYVGLAVFAMVITPADPFTMLIAFGPLVALFELSVWISRPMALLRARETDDADASP